MIVGDVLNRELQVWRRAFTVDDSGGRVAVWAQVATVWASVSQPSAAERTVAAQSGALLTHVIYLLPDAQVARGDELRGNGQVFEVDSVVSPSRPVYRRANCHQTQSEAEVL